MIDERIADAYRGVTLDKDSAGRIWSALERELRPGKQNRPVKTMRNPLRVALIAAVLSVLMIGTAYAAFAVPRWTGTWRRGGEAEYTELAALGQVEKTVGYRVAAVQEFENGYVFQRMRVDGEAVFAEQSYTGVAVDEAGGVVGLYILHPNNVGRCGHICNASYAVKGACRGRHIGEKLVLDCLRMGRELGFQVLQFNAVVECNPHARHLYERLGFVQLGTIPGGFRMKDGHYENICPYYREL